MKALINGLYFSGSNVCVIATCSENQAQPDEVSSYVACVPFDAAFQGLTRAQKISVLINQLKAVRNGTLQFGNVSQVIDL